MDIIKDSINELKKWSNKKEFNTLFDSNTDGDCSKSSFTDKLLLKANLYFICVDDSKNVFGGYVSQPIQTINSSIQDTNSFVFALLRNGIPKRKAYPIKKGYEKHAFVLHSGASDILASFGSGYPCDIAFGQVGNKLSFCCPYSYDYNNEWDPLVDTNYPDKFRINRLIVIEGI